MPTRAISPADVTRIGAVGCSNTRQHLQAYQDSSTQDKFWPWESVDDYSGGTLANWAYPREKYWTIFNANAALYPDTSVVWIQMCIRSGESSQTGMSTEQQDDLVYVINRVKQTLPNATIVVSPLNGFVAQDCSATGLYGQPNSVELADWAAAQGIALRGPDTGPLDHSQLQSDFCHLNKAGRAFVGPQMAGFFDNFAPPSPTTYWCVDSNVLTVTDGSTPAGSYVAGPFATQAEAANDPGCMPPPPAYWCVDGSVISLTDGSTPGGSYVAGPFNTSEEAAADLGCVPPPITYWCVDGAVITTDGSTPTGTYVAGPYATTEEASSDPGCIPPPIAYWCVDGAVISLNDGSTPEGTYVAGPYTSQLDAEADPGCAPPPPAYWCVDANVLTITDGSTPAGNYVAGPFATLAEAANDPGCVPPPPPAYWCVDANVLMVTDGSTPTGSYVAGPFGTTEEAANDPGCLPPPIINCNAVISMSQGKQVYYGFGSGDEELASPLEAKTGDEWMLLFKSGKTLSWFTSTSNWSTLDERHRCGTDADIDQIVFIFDPFGSSNMITDLNIAIGIMQTRYPNAEIDVSLLVGGANHAICQILNLQGRWQNIRASSTHASHIGQMTMPEAGADLDIPCNDYADKLGHLTDAGAALANQQLADFLTP